MVGCNRAEPMGAGSEKEEQESPHGEVRCDGEILVSISKLFQAKKVTCVRVVVCTQFDTSTVHVTYCMSLYGTIATSAGLCQMI